MQSSVEAFEKQGYALVKNFLPKDVALFLSDYLKVRREIKILNGDRVVDEQIPDAACVFWEEPVLETLYLQYTKEMEKVTGLSLVPTYIYARIYAAGNELRRHKDRPSCEISATIKLDESEQYTWPICVEQGSFELDVGDAVIYRGCDVMHWRDKCEADKDYFLSQMFMHFVDKNGPNTEYIFDKMPTRQFVLSKLMSS
jgi:hypothetical protein